MALKRTSIDVEENLWKQVRGIAGLKGRPISECVAEALTAWVKKQNLSKLVAECREDEK